MYNTWVYTEIRNNDLFPDETVPGNVRNPCVPSPCGPNSECRDVGNTPSCSCLTSFIGSPPNCRPECTIHADCPSDRACINSKCQDPCPGSCGVSAVCNVLNHIPICTCIEAYVGDPFTSCRPKPLEGIYYCFGNTCRLNHEALLLIILNIIVLLQLNQQLWMLVQIYVVDLMQNVSTVNANVCQNIMVIHTLIADQSAFSALIVINLKHAFKGNVSTRALAPAGKMPYVKW